MTNTIYFYNTLRSYFSSSSSFSSSVDYSDQTPQYYGATTEEVARPHAQVKQEEEDDEAITQFLPAMHQQPTRTDEEESSEKLSSKFVSPTSQCSTLKRFDFVELRIATRNFHPSAALKGTLGSVYKGWVDEHELTSTKLGRGMAIFIVVLNPEGFQDHTKWLEEAIHLGHSNHPNLLRLLGYCLDDTNRLLVYEFTPRGSLKNLFGGIWPGPKIPRSQRLNVALDAAKGLAFIHSSKIVHGCFKPSNILLNYKYNAKLFGFGLTKPSPTTFPIQVTDTPNFGCAIDDETIYDAPEYRYTGRFSAKSDVYSFGVVFLELLFGRRAFQNFGPWEERNLVRWIKSRRNLRPIFVGILHSRKCGEKAVQIALQCLSVEVKFRPTMGEVVEALEILLYENNRKAAQQRLNSNSLVHLDFPQ